MSALKSGLSNLFNYVSNCGNLAGFGFQQVRHRYKGAWMVRDVKRRNLAKDWGPLRIRVVAMKRNKVLPPELKTLASEEMEKIPRATGLMQLTPRCALTSRGRGVVYPMRLSRIVFRDLADHNLLSGFQRAMW